MTLVFLLIMPIYCSVLISIMYYNDVDIRTKQTPITWLSTTMFFIVSVLCRRGPSSLNLADTILKKELTHTILLHPSYFGPRMLNFLESKLYSDVEGTCSGQFGYIIAVVSILDIGKGMVLSGSGQAEFITRYRAIVFKPFKGEVVDGVVNNVNKVRIFDA